MKSLGRTGAVLVLGLTFGCSQQSSVAPTSIANRDSNDASSVSASGGATSGTMASTPLSATVQFGLPGIGSGFPPTSGHDQSAHANDTLVPETVVIDQGGTVTFDTFGVHQIAIYAPGVEPGDIDTSNLTTLPAGCPPLPLLINDSQNRVALYATGCGPRTITHTFSQPGRYLVICAFLPHFEIKMYGWVIVRDR